MSELVLPYTTLPHFYDVKVRVFAQIVRILRLLSDYLDSCPFDQITNLI